jgi:hypothetical protein
LVFNRTESEFWQSLNAAMQCAAPGVKHIANSSDFHAAFALNTWSKPEMAVLILDEFTLLLGAQDSLRDRVLGQLRTFRNLKKAYAIQSVVICGTFSLAHLTATQKYTSPFNVGDHFQNPFFSKEDVQQLFSEFANENMITIDKDVVEDVWLKSNGYVTRLDQY